MSYAVAPFIPPFISGFTVSTKHPLRTDYLGDNAYRPSVRDHHAWVRTFPRLPMSRHGTYSWNVPHLYLFCLWVIYGFTTKTPTTSPESISLKNNRIPVPLLLPYSLDGWILKSCKQIVTNYFMFFNDVPFRLQARTCIISKRAAYTGLTPTWGTL